MADELFTDALHTALREPEIADALATLAGDDEPDGVRAELEQAADENRAEIEAAARVELAELARDRAALYDMVLPLVEAAIRDDPEYTPARAAARADAEIEAITARTRFSLLARAPEDVTLAAAARRLSSAEAAARRSLLERGVLPFCRGWINHRLQDRDEKRYSLTLEATKAPGLAELPNPDHEVATPDGKHLERLVGQLPGGSVGLSGPRGSGKTTLLRSFHQGRRRINGRAPGLTAMVSAPVEYSPRDFVLHLFERVCLAAGAESHGRRAALAASEDRDDRLRRLTRATLVVVAAGAAAVAIGAWLLFEEADAAGVSSDEQLALLTGALLVCGLLLWPRNLPRPEPAGVRIAIAAVLAVAIAVAAFVDEAPGWPDWLWIAVGCLWLGAHAGLAAYRTRAVASGPFARDFAFVVLAEGGVIAFAGFLGADIGDRALTGGVLLLAGAGALLAGALDPLMRVRHEREGPDWTGHLVAAALVWAGAVVQCIGLALLAFDLRASDELVVAIGLLAGGLWWLEIARGRRATAERFEARVEAMEPSAAARPPTDAEERRAPALEALEDVVAAALEQGEDSPEFGEILSILRTWRTSGGELDSARLTDAVGAALYGTDAEGELNAALYFAFDELSQRDERRESWKAGAEVALRQIRYQQSFSATWSGRVGIARPLAVEAARTGGTSAAEVPMTLPQIVTALQDYLRLASAVEPVVIAIDELDKMASADAAERFLNEVKAIFGVANCYFLISVSEDAVASFERRGLPFRDVVDSSFDEVLRVGYLSLDDAEKLLGKRVVLLPKPFAALCHALSGGLARDLIRTARALFDLRELTEQAALAELAPALVRAELKAKRDGTVTVIRGLATERDVSPVLCWLASVPLDDLSLASIRDNPAPLGAADGALVRLVREFVGFWYFCVTLVDVFTTRLSFDELRGPAVMPGGARDLDAFARARQSFVVDPQLAWTQISAIREAWALDAVASNGAGVIQRLV